ncbi:MAG: OB-fold domain-containing protein [Deltaproteobacteria bacterium]|nr:OB-fold domain-containing protein [Deltaproteobacteria bacterium]MBI3387805.1 OB-fold domain-containing protein [Deltaproteobacteria bacterium]
MTTATRPRVPIKPGYFTIPDDPGLPPKLLGTKCQDCGEHYFPRRAICARPECLSEKTSDVELGPRGTLYSYTFVHLPLFGSSNLEHAEGYGVGQVDLPEGPRVQLPLAGKQGEFRIGQTLEAELNTLREDGGSDIVIVRFRPVEAGR